MLQQFGRQLKRIGEKVQVDSVNKFLNNGPVQFGLLSYMPDSSIKDPVEDPVKDPVEDPVEDPVKDPIKEQS